MVDFDITIHIRAFFDINQWISTIGRDIVVFDHARAFAAFFD